MILPKIKGRWLLYWVIVVPVIYEVVKHMFDPVVTLGDIIVLATTVPALVFGIWKAAAYFLYRNHPFKLEYQKQLVWEGNRRPTYKKLSLPLGTSSFIVRVQPKRFTTFKRIHLRLLDKHSIDDTFPSKEIVHFDTVNVTGEGLHYPLAGVNQDYTNGIQGSLQEDWDCTSEESLFVDLKVTASAHWKGYLMFQSHREDKHRGCGYLPLEVGVE